MNRIVTTFIAILATAILLSACGGGGETTSLTWTGTRQLGVSSQVTDAKGIAVDASGKVYVAGGTTGGLDKNTLTGTQDFFLTSYNSLGQKISTKQTGTAGASTFAGGVAVDSGGNVYVAGVTDGGLDGNTLIGLEDAFLTKYDKNGNKLFTVQTGTAGAATSAESAAVDLIGNVYLTGNTTGGLDGNTLAGTQDFFLIKSSSSGSVLYTRQTGTAGALTFATGVAIDSGGNVYVTGQTYGGLDGNTLIGTSDAFLTKYDMNGNKLFTIQTGTAGADTSAAGVAVDSSGNVYVTGWTTGGLEGNTLIGSKDAFLTKYGSSGTRLYTKQTGTAGAQTSGYGGVAVDSSGNVYVAGSTTGALDGNIRKGTEDLILIKFGGSAGNWIFTRQLGATSATTYASGIALDSGGNVYVTGNTTGGLNGNTLTGTQDIFVIKFDPSGNKL